MSLARIPPENNYVGSLSNPISDPRCCICLKDDDRVETICCRSGAMHCSPADPESACGLTYVKRARMAQNYPLICPGCRREYRPRDLADHLLPARRLFRCEGAFFPLDNASILRILAYEYCDDKVFQRLDFRVGNVAQDLPIAPNAVYPVSEYYDLIHHYYYNNNTSNNDNTWPPPPSLRQMLMDPVFRVLKRRTDSSTQTSPPAEPETSTTTPPPDFPSTDTREERRSYSLAPMASDALNARDALYKLRHTTHRMIRATGSPLSLTHLTGRARRLRNRKLTKIHEHVIEAMRQLNAGSNELLELYSST